MANQLSSLDGVFHALSDPTRRAVVRQLGSGQASVSELAKPHDMALPSFMKHLGVLEQCGLVRSSKQGRIRTCHLVTKKLSTAEKWISQQRCLWEGRAKRLVEYSERTEKGAK